MIPNGWEIKKMSDVVIWGSGGTPKATEAAYYENGTIPWLVIGDLNDGVVNSSASKITELGLKNSSAKLIPPGTLLVAMYGSIGKLGITGIECCTNQAIAFAKELHGVTTQYMFYYMVLIKAKLISMGKGGTQKNISQAVLKSLDVIVPPLSEQKRIVSRIEELFSQLDASVAKLKTAKERLKVYRQAVLKEAFSKFDGSIEKTISSVCENIVDCPHSTPKSVQKGKLCLRTTNFKPGYLNLSEKNYVSEETFCERISRLAPKPGDVLFSREGAILGIACIIPDGLEVCMGQRMMLLRPSEDLLNKYLMYYLNSPKARTLIIENVGGTASPHINVGDIKNFTIPIIPFAQQQSVVAEIESRLSVCDNIEKTVGTALQQAEALRQSILKIAFEGRLD